MVLTYEIPMNYISYQTNIFTATALEELPHLIMIYNSIRTHAMVLNYPPSPKKRDPGSIPS